MPMKFRAHDTFFIRKGWLSKGMRCVSNKPDVFVSRDENPMDVLGIGANMVKALRYWLQAVGITTEPNKGKRTQTFTELGKLIIENDTYTLETKDHVHKQLQRYKYWLSCSLIIIDDMMYTGLSDEELMLFYHTVMLLNETRSIVIITNRELSGWSQSGNDRHLMQTLIERLSANSQQIRLT